VSAALAAGVCGAMVLDARWPERLTRAEPRASAVAAVVLGDTVASTLRDTVRLVRFMLVAPAASRVALAGDFNGWSAAATPLAAGPGGVWSGAVSLAPGRHHYAFIVDDTGWVADPAAGRAAGDGGHAHSVVTVPGTSN
jgi:1,4-alpha-glucan branching enzyme